MASLGHNELTHWGLVVHMHQWTRWSVVQVMSCTYSALSHNLNKWVLIFYWSPGTFFSEIRNKTQLFFQENILENIICKMSAICLWVNLPEPNGVFLCFNESGNAGGCFVCVGTSEGGVMTVFTMEMWLSTMPAVRYKHRWDSLYH